MGWLKGWIWGWAIFEEARKCLGEGVSGRTEEAWFTLGRVLWEGKRGPGNPKGMELNWTKVGHRP